MENKELNDSPKLQQKLSQYDITSSHQGMNTDVKPYRFKERRRRKVYRIKHNQLHEADCRSYNLACLKYWFKNDDLEECLLSIWYNLDINTRWYRKPNVSWQRREWIQVVELFSWRTARYILGTDSQSWPKRRGQRGPSFLTSAKHNSKLVYDSEAVDSGNLLTSWLSIGCTNWATDIEHLRIWRWNRY